MLFVNLIWIAKFKGHTVVTVVSLARVLIYNSVLLSRSALWFRITSCTYTHTHIPNSQWWHMLLKQPELVDSRRPPAVSGAWDPDTQKERV